MPRSAPKLLRPAQARHAKPTGREDSGMGGKKKYLFLFSSLVVISRDQFNSTTYQVGTSFTPVNMNVYFNEKWKEVEAKR